MVGFEEKRGEAWLGCFLCGFDDNIGNFGAQFLWRTRHK